MLKFTSKTQIFITYGERSKKQFATELFLVVARKFRRGIYTEEQQTMPILEFFYGWAAERFIGIMHFSAIQAFV
jgi:hypothetical protein